MTKQITIIATHIINNFLCFSFQSLESELVCSTAYLELFIRKITEPRLLAVFLQFLFTETHDGKVIIDILVTRLALQSQVRNIPKIEKGEASQNFFLSNFSSQQSLYPYLKP